MLLRLLTLFFILVFGQPKAQHLSTVFIDTVKIVVDNKTTYESNKTILKFIPINKDSILTIYNDGVYRLNMKLAHLESNNYTHLVFSDSEFYINDSLCNSRITINNGYENCSNTDILITSLKNYDFYNPKMPEKFKVNIYCRLVNMAPEDTLNYQYNYREGLWIGFDRGVKKITVNYKNDKKHGLATAFFENDVTYNVNFNNNYADKYGQGYWLNYKNRDKLKSIYLIPNIVTLSCDSIKTHSRESFYLSRGKKTKDIRRHHDLSVYYEKKGLQHDSIEFRARGDFMNIADDSIVIKTEELEIHDFYKKNTDTLHNFYQKNKTGFVKIPIKDITKMYYKREIGTQIATQTALLSFVSALIVAPLVSIQKKGFNTDRYKKVSLSSLGVMTLSIGIGVGISQKEFLLTPTKKNNKTWKIEYDAYE